MRNLPTATPAVGFSCYIPNVLPVPGMGSFYDIIAWGSSIILAARWHYLFYGDKGVLEENYDAGMRYLNHLKSKVTPEGFINHGLGDWGNPDGQLTRENVETVFLYAAAKTLAFFAKELDKEEDHDMLMNYANQVKDSYNSRLLVKDDSGRYCYQNYDRREDGLITTQTTQAIPLYWGLVPDYAKADAVDCLRENIESGGALVAGEVGLPYVIQSAAENGMNDLIVKCILKPEHPSYYAFILDGETTLGEYWESNPRSHCHDMMGHIMEWYYNGIAGIKILEPGFKKIRFKPFMPESINRFECSYESPYGVIRVCAERTDDRVDYRIQAPEEVEVVYEI